MSNGGKLRKEAEALPVEDMASPRSWELLFQCATSTTSWPVSARMRGVEGSVWSFASTLKLTGKEGWQSVAGRKAEQ